LSTIIEIFEEKKLHKTLSLIDLKRRNSTGFKINLKKKK